MKEELPRMTAAQGVDELNNICFLNQIKMSAVAPCLSDVSRVKAGFSNGLWNANCNMLISDAVGQLGLAYRLTSWPCDAVELVRRVRTEILVGVRPPGLQGPPALQGWPVQNRMVESHSAEAGLRVRVFLPSSEPQGPEPA